MLKIRAGMKIGQMIFWKGEPVPEDASYYLKGQYNHDKQAQPSKGLR
jgi:deoxycytidine triphosphate deaminase